MAIITAADEITSLRKSGRIAAQALRAVVAAVRVGVTTAELNEIAERSILEQGGKPSFKGYEGYPFTLCTSVNDVVVHGMPSDQALAEGDIIGLDIGAVYEGLYSDHAITVGVGRISSDLQRLMTDTEQSLKIGLRQVRPGQRIGDIGAAISAFLEPRGYGIVTQLTGHGLGYAVHEPPAIPNIGRPNTGPVIRSGMVLAIEPMVTLGQPQVVTGDDGWTITTVDHSASAHAEHTVLVTEHGCDIITTP